ncbi:MAG: thioredoxin fold domain-containing protein [Muribaculaceae bacterium]|nr:thioredoxin fold domain-containing protein [Muribaculaceae bacterium]
MRRFLFAIAILLVFTACNNKAGEGQDETTDASGKAKSEMPVASPDDEGQDEWTKQTTIMSSKPMVIDFFATWCGPCKQLAPILDEIEQNHKGEIIFKRIDVDQEPELAQEFRIEAIPTLMFVTPKGDYQTLMGLQDAEVIEAKIAELLSRSSK